nr:RecName: Full=Allergen Fus s I3596*; AltName: Allergen=Fus s 1 [Fusarium vanettenii]
TIMSHNVP